MRIMILFVATIKYQHNITPLHCISLKLRSWPSGACKPALSISHFPFLGLPLASAGLLAIAPGQCRLACNCPGSVGLLAVAPGAC